MTGHVARSSRRAAGWRDRRAPTAGVLTLRAAVFARWTGIVALVGAISFLVILDGTTDGSPFGYGFFPGVVALVTWTAATSISTYRQARAAIPAAPSAE
jgi:hypothetical protein